MPIRNDNDKKKKGSLILSAIMAICAVMIFHIEFGIGRYNIQDLMASTWAYLIMLAIVFFATFTFIFLITNGVFKQKTNLTEEEKQAKKKSRAEIIFLIIDVIMTGSFVRMNWLQLSSQSLMWSIAEVVAFFAIVLSIFELFNKFTLFPQKITRFFMDFFVYVCIPAMLLIIVLLGAYQAKYGYQDVFVPAVNSSAIGLGNAMQIAYTNLVFTLYHIGQSNPELWSWLPIAAFFIFTILLIMDTFTKKNKTDEEKNAQELINEALKEDFEEQEYELGMKKRPFFYNFFLKLRSKKEIEKELKSKQDMENAHYNIYNAKLIFKQMKGGKNK